MLLSRRPDVEAFLASPGKARAAVVHGRDQGVVRERAMAIATRIAADPNDPFDVARLAEGDLASDPARLEGELQALSMIGGRRLVWLRLSVESAPAERAVAETMARHLAGELNDAAFFLVESPALRADGPLLKAGRDSPLCAIIACYEDEPGELVRLARASLVDAGLALTPAAMDLFVGRLPHDRGVARQEIERLILFLGPRRRAPADVADLQPFLGVEPDASLGDAAICVFGGRLAAAQAQLRLAFQEGEGGVAAIRALGLHLGRLRRFGILRAGGAAAQQAARAAGVFWRNEREVVRQAQVWTPQRLTRPARALLEAEMACKRAGAPDRLVAERLAHQVAEQARALGL